MTDQEREDLKNTGSAMIAYSQGKPVQIKGRDDWEDCIPQWAPNRRYRPKPEPQMRDWNCPEDVPGPVCYLRSKKETAGWTLVIAASEYGVAAANPARGAAGFRVPYSVVSDECEYSTTRRKDDWHPCKVLVP